MGFNGNFHFFILTGNTLFKKIWSKKSKVSNLAIILYLQQLKSVKLGGDVHFFCYQPLMPYLCKFCPKAKKRKFKLKFGSWRKTDMPNFSTFDLNCHFWANLVQRVENVSLS